jgi:MFS family permease
MGRMLIRPAAAKPNIPISLVFFLLGMMAGVWAARIPAISGPLRISPGILGLVLLGSAAGSVLAIPAAGAALTVLPARRLIQIGLLPVCALLPATTAATSGCQLFLILAVWGAGVGTVDVAMNTAGMAIQDQLARRVMSTFHGWFSAGGLAGAGFSALAATANVAVRTNFVVAAVIVASAGIAGAQALGDIAVHDKTPVRADSPVRGEIASESGTRFLRRPLLSWRLTLLALMAFASFMSEGSADSWSAVYMHTSLGAPTGLAAAAYAAFSCAMMGGRFIGDRLADISGPVRLIRVATAAASITFTIVLIMHTPWFGLLGFAVLGLGLSFVVPLVIAAAYSLGEPVGVNVAFVTSGGYLGMMVGPPVIGFVAWISSLSTALGIIAALTGMLALLAGNVRRSG